VTAEAGKGAVKVTVTGDQRVTDVQIDAALLAAGDAKKLSGLIQEAFNKALEDSREMAKKRLGPLASGLGG
jgi:DNA-binding protein YbaB